MEAYLFAYWTFLFGLAVGVFLHWLSMGRPQFQSKRDDWQQRIALGEKRTLERVKEIELKMAKKGENKQKHAVWCREQYLGKGK